ncbi:hypothetical protein BGX23_008625 [Mortierella sp. AD031]|nr:hypothetical protein BGX23_008625 [Mortierella sp. AD031]
MQLSLVSLPKNPLELPEIRTRVASFLNRKDCLSCICVSRDWFHDFVKPVWHTVDFAKDTAFVNVTSDVLEKYGHYIRQVLNISTLKHLTALQHPSVDSLQSVDALLNDNMYHRELHSDLIRRSRGVLSEMKLSFSPANPDTVIEQRKWAKHFFHVDTILSRPASPNDSTSGYGPNLTSLSLDRLSFTHEGFTALFRYSPVLQELKLFQVVVFHHPSAFKLFQESTITSLSASLGQVFLLDPEEPKAPSLLSYFPLLEKWRITSLARPSNWPSDPLCVDFSSSCPLLKTVWFGDDNAETMSNLLLHSFTSLKTVSFSALNVAMSTSLGLIAHLETLTSITITDKIQDPSLMTWLHFVLKLCRNLEVLSIEFLVLDMDAVEKYQWSCENLKELRVQFKGLDTPQDIDECLKNVCVRRHTSDTPLTGPGTNMKTISSRVTHHLLQFRKLKTVWLGTKMHYLSCKNN